MTYQRGYCDFPWAFNSRSTWNKTKFGGGVHGSYDIISPEEARYYWAPWIDSLFSSNAVMFWWVVSSQLDWGIELLKLCGFRLSTIGFTWVKIYKDGSLVKNPGWHKAGNVELCLIGMRGSFKQPPEERMVQEVYETEWPGWVEVNHGGLTIKHPRITTDKGKIIHSRKPPIFKQLIDRLYPAWVYGKGIELFAREKTNIDDWHYFGNEIESDIKGPNMRQLRVGVDNDVL